MPNWTYMDWHSSFKYQQRIMLIENKVNNSKMHLKIIECEPEEVM